MDEVSPDSKELAKGSLFSLAGNFFFKLVSFLYVVLIAQTVAQEELGLFYLAMGFISLTAIIDDLGLPMALVRYVPYFEGKGEKARIKGLLRMTYSLVSASAILLTAIMFLSADLLGGIYSNDKLPDAVRFLSLYLFLSNIFKVNNAFMQSRGDIASLQMAQNAQNVLKLLITLALMQSYGPSFVSVAGGFLLSYALVLPLTFFQVFRNLKDLGGTGGSVSLPMILHEILPLGLMLNFLGSLNAAIGGTSSILLGYLVEPAMASTTVAVYSVVTALSYIFLAFQSSIGAIFLPMMSRLHGKNDLKQMEAVTDTAQRWSLFLSLPIGITLVFFSGELINVVYGQGFISGAAAMSIFSFGLLAASFSSMYSSLLSSMRLVRDQLYMLLASGITIVLLNLILIPGYGMLGTAMASMAGFILHSLLLRLYVMKMLGFRTPSETIRLAAAAVATIALVILAKPFLPPMDPLGTGSLDMLPRLSGLVYMGLALLSVSLIFLAFSISLRCFRREDIGIIGKVMKKAMVPGPIAGVAEKILQRGLSGG